MAPLRSKLLVPGKTCWQVVAADRLAVIIDGQDYYHAVKQAMLNAKHQIIMLGWDFDTRVEFQPGCKTLAGPNRLGPFLNWLANQRPELGLHILQWKMGAFKILWRGETPLMILILRWLFKHRIDLRLDNAHPTAASHHQKIIVIDDAIAFCGGIDITAGRWDTRAHLDVNPARRTPLGRRLPPWHDVTTCVAGPAAAAFGQLARARWARATGQQLPVPPATKNVWPACLPPAFAEVKVGISRTMGAYAAYPQVTEIEALTLRAIRAAKSTIYIEGQYFASRTVAAALVKRLQEPTGPEIVMINPQTQVSWLQEKTMGGARAKLLRYVKRADTFNRFRVYYPVTAGNRPIYVHAKVIIVDDTFLKIGSSNLNNRSMGFDTECDLTLDATLGPATSQAAVRQKIRQTRNDLLAEHLGISLSRLNARLTPRRALIAVLDHFTATNPRLLPLAIRDLDLTDDLMAENDLLDPERPPGPWVLLFEFIRKYLARLKPSHRAVRIP